MSGMKSLFARLISRTIAPIQTSVRSRNANHFRPSLEQCESREVPAGTYTWAGMVSSDSQNPSNWSVVGEPPGQLPNGDDTLIFNGSALRSCDNLISSTDSFAAVSILNGYLGTVTLGEDLTFGTFELKSGAIAQPNANSDLTVTGSFTWTGGTLNSSAYLSTLTISGSTTTALFAPASGGTVNLGSSISLANGAAGTIKDGAINLNKDGIQISTSTGSSLLVAPDGLASVLIGVAQFYLDGQIGLGTSWTVKADAAVRFRGKLTNAGGTATLLPGASAEITGNPLNPLSNLAYVQVGGGAAATYLHGNSELVTPGMSIAIDTGILATVYSSDAGTANATIRTDLLEIRGGDIYIDYQGTNYHFGELVVAGNVKWTGGIFHVYVYAGGTANDVWRTTNPGGNSGRFDIDGGTVAPIYLDSDYGTSSLPTSGTSWEVLKAGGGFVDNDAPSVDDTILWSMAIDNESNPPIYWRLVAN